ncbi:MAG: lipoprotein, partial [Bacteroidales bacterium]|nr:lipoprotein [Bacteroidales bacterium]
MKKFVIGLIIVLALSSCQKSDDSDEIPVAA